MVPNAISEIISASFAMEIVAAIYVIPLYNMVYTLSYHLDQCQVQTLKIGAYCFDSNIGILVFKYSGTKPCALQYASSSLFPLPC